jgi:hypothetical protein
MKIEDAVRPGLIALGLAGMAATALVGFAAGVAAGRDPEGLKRTARRVMRETAQGLERAALMAAQAREHIADLWAEAREEAIAEVDAADFAKAQASRTNRRGAGGSTDEGDDEPPVRTTRAARPVAKRRRSRAGGTTPS